MHVKQVSLCLSLGDRFPFETGRYEAELSGFFSGMVGPVGDGRLRRTACCTKCSGRTERV